MTNEFVIVRKNQNSVMWHNIRTIEPLCGFFLFEARIFKYGGFNRGVKKMQNFSSVSPKLCVLCKKSVTWIVNIEIIGTSLKDGITVEDEMWIFQFLFCLI